MLILVDIIIESIFISIDKEASANSAEIAINIIIKNNR